MIKYFAIVTSPLQLINFKEFIENFSINDYKIIVLIKKDNTINQIYQVAETLNLEISRVISLKIIIHFFYLKKLSKQIDNVDKLIIGQLFSDPILFFVNRVKYNELVILDDGLANIHVKEALINKIPIVKPNKLKLFFKKKLNLTVEIPDKATIYTIFNIDPTNEIKIIKNNLRESKKRISEKEIIYNEVLIIGQPFVENYEISKNDYLNIIQNLCSLNQTKITYLAHRREKLKNLKYISKIDNVKIEISELNFELYLAIRKNLPYKILGFSSTALITSKILIQNNSNIIIESIKLDNSIIKKNKTKIQSCYKEIAEFKIPVLSIKEAYKSIK